MRFHFKKIQALLLSLLLICSMLVSTPGLFVVYADPPPHPGSGENAAIWFNINLFQNNQVSVHKASAAALQKIDISYFPIVAEAQAAHVNLEIAEPSSLTAAHILVQHFKNQGKNPWSDIQWNPDGTIHSILGNFVSQRYVKYGYKNSNQTIVDPIVFITASPYQCNTNPFQVKVEKGQWIRIESMGFLTKDMSLTEPVYRTPLFSSWQESVIAGKEFQLGLPQILDKNGAEIPNPIIPPKTRDKYYYEIYKYEDLLAEPTANGIRDKDEKLIVVPGWDPSTNTFPITFKQSGLYIMKLRAPACGSGFYPTPTVLVRVLDGSSPLALAIADAKKIIDAKSDYWNENDRLQYKKVGEEIQQQKEPEGFWKSFEAIYRSALDLNASATATDEEKEAAAQKLKAASQLVIPKQEANLTLLLEEAQQAEELKNSPAWASYAKSTQEALEKALQEQATLLETLLQALPVPFAKQEAIDKLVKALQDAKANLTTDEVAADLRKQLQSFLEEVLLLQEQDYTKESWAPLKQACDKAQTLLQEESCFRSYLEQSLDELKELYYYKLVDQDGVVRIHMQIDDFGLHGNRDPVGGSFLQEHLEVRQGGALPSKYFLDYTGSDPAQSSSPTVGAALAQAWEEQGMVPEFLRKIPGNTYLLDDILNMVSCIVGGTGGLQDALVYDQSPEQMAVLEKVLLEQDSQTLERFQIDPKLKHHKAVFDHFTYLKTLGYSNEQLIKAPITGGDGRFDYFLGGAMAARARPHNVNTNLHINGRLVSNKNSGFDIWKVVLHEGDVVTLAQQGEWKVKTLSKFDQAELQAQTGQEVVFHLSSAEDKTSEYKPLAGAPLWISAPSKTPRAYAASVDKMGLTDASGNFTYRFVRPGHYLVSARGEGNKGFMPSFCRVSVTGDELPEDAAVDAVVRAIAQRFSRIDPAELSDWWQIGMGVYAKRSISEEQKAAFARKSVGELRSIHGPATGQPAVWTDYARIGIALSSVGYDVSNLGAYGLELKDKYGHSVEDMIQDGCAFNHSYTSNGPIWMLILLDSRNYKVPENSRWTREALVADILEYQAGNGSFSLFDRLHGQGSASDVDMTGMALQALAPYQDQPAVKEAVTKAITWLSSVQTYRFPYAEDDNGNPIHEERGGDFQAAVSYGPGSYKNLNPTSESTSQVIIALTALGIDPHRDPQFRKGTFLSGTYSAISGLQKYIIPSGDGLAHKAVEDMTIRRAAYYYNGMATEQGFLAFQSYQKFLQNGGQRTRLYFFGDALPVQTDKSALAAAIAAAQKLDLSLYKELGVARFRWTLQRAEKTLANPYVNQERVNATWTTLIDAFLLLEKRATREDLEAMVERLNQAMEHHPQQRFIRFFNHDRSNTKVQEDLDGAAKALQDPALEEAAIQEWINKLHQSYTAGIRSYTLEDEILCRKFRKFDPAIGKLVFTEYWNPMTGKIGEEVSFLAPDIPYASGENTLGIIAAKDVTDTVDDLLNPVGYGTMGGDRPHLHQTNILARQVIAQLHYKPFAMSKDGEELLINPAEHLKPLIERASGLDQQDFTAESWAVLHVALEEAKTLYAAQSTTPSSLGIAGKNAGRAPPAEETSAEDASKKDPPSEELAQNAASSTTASALGLETPEGHAKASNDEKPAAADASANTATPVTSSSALHIGEEKDRAAVTTSSALQLQKEGKAPSPVLQSNHTAVEIANACTKLMRALNALRAERKDLDVLLEKAEKLTQNAFKPAQWAILKESIADAKRIRENPYVTRRHVLDSIEDLQGIYDETLLHPQAPDKQLLQAIVGAVDDLVEVNYEKEPWATFVKAYQEGKTLLEQTGSSQQIMNESLLKIANATRGLVKHQDPAALQALLEKAKAQKCIGTQDALWNVLQDAIQAAQAQLENPKALQQEINEAYNHLHNALLQYRATHSENTDPVNPEDPDYPVHPPGPQDPKPPSVPEDPKPPVEKPEVPEGSKVTFSIDKETIGKGYVLAPTDIDLKQGESVWDVFQRATSLYHIPFRHRFSSQYNSVYIESIDGDGEFDHGSGSGWMYNVNGVYPMVGASLCYPKPGDVIQWRYTTNLGDDIGGGMGMGGVEKLRETLKEAIDSAKAYNKNEYTKASYDKLQEALQEAQRIYDDKVGDKHKIHAALKKLSDAIKAMEKLGEKDSQENYRQELERQIKQLGSLDEKLFDKDSFALLQQALEEARAILQKKDATVEELKAALEKLQEASANLKTLHGENIKPVQEQEEALEAPQRRTANPLRPLALPEKEPEVDYGYRYKDHSAIASWAAQYVLKARSYGLMVGDKQERFRPKEHITRAQIAAIFSNMLGDIDVPNAADQGAADQGASGQGAVDQGAADQGASGQGAVDQGAAGQGASGQGAVDQSASGQSAADQSASGQSAADQGASGHRYSDVKPESWYYDAVEKISALDIMVGTGDGKFSPEKTLTREEFAALLQNYLRYEERGAAPKDIDQVSPWAKDAVEKIYASGLMSGYNEKFEPKAPVTREMAAAVMVKLYETLAAEQREKEARQEQERIAGEKAAAAEKAQAEAKAKEEQAQKEEQEKKWKQEEEAAKHRVFATYEEWDSYVKEQEKRDAVRNNEK